MGTYEWPGIYPGSVERSFLQVNLWKRQIEASTVREEAGQGWQLGLEVLPSQGILKKDMGR